MSTITISVPDDLRAKAEAEAARGGYVSIESYICALLRRDLEHDIDQDLEVELLKGLDSPAEEMNAGDWDQMRRDLIQRHQNRK